MREYIALEFEVFIDPSDSKTIRLVHWDDLHGSDTTILLDKDGAKLKSYDNDFDYDVFEPVDLLSTLLDVIRNRSEEQEAYREMLQEAAAKMNKRSQ